MIHEVFPDSPAAKSNVLKPGFRINKINETELKNMTHEAAMEVLRSAQDKVCNGACWSGCVATLSLTLSGLKCFNLKGLFLYPSLTGNFIPIRKKK